MKLTIIGSDGPSEEPSNPEAQIEQVLPSRLHNFFFFDGERIEKLAKDSAYEEIEQAIKSILGLQILDRSIAHLGGPIKQSLDKELSKVGTKELQDIIEKIQIIEGKLESEIGNLENENANKSSIDENIEAVTVFAGTGLTAFSTLPVIAEIAKEKGIRSPPPCRRWQCHGGLANCHHSLAHFSGRHLLFQ